MTDPKNKNDKNKIKNEKTPQDQPSNSSRRDLLKGAGLLGAAVAGAAPSSLVAQQSAPANSIPLREALEVLTAKEAEVLEAVCDTLIPSDENGPGAVEARAAHYIDQTLASHNEEHRNAYFESLTAIDEFARTEYNTNFAQLNSTQRIAVVTALQNNEITDCTPGFFALVRNHTIDGTFCDPYYGGNRDFVGWDLLRYPGVRLSASEEDVAAGSSLAPTHQSAYDNSAYTKQVTRSTAIALEGDDDD